MAESKNLSPTWKPHEFDPLTSDDEIVSVPLGGEPLKCLKIGDALMSLKWKGITPDYRKHIPSLQNMEMTADDVIICSSVKSGSHWVWEITNMLKAGIAEYQAKEMSSGLMEFTSVDKLRAIPKPRVFITHFSFPCLPKDVIRKKCKLILLRRNPKDIMVSNLSFLQGLGSIDQDVQWNEYFEKFLEIDVESSMFNWFYYTKSWYEVLKEKTYNIHIINFEDLKEDPIKEITRLAKFLNVSVIGTLIQDIADKCSFKNLKAAAKSKSGPYKDKTDVFYRKGEVGDWKNYFTVAQNEKFDAVYNERMKDVNIEYRYTLYSH